MNKVLTIVIVGGILVGIYLYSTKKKHLAQVANEAAAATASIAAKKALQDLQAKRKQDAEEAARKKTEEAASAACVSATGLSKAECQVWIGEKAYAKSLANSGAWGSPNPRAGADNAPQFIWHKWDEFQKIQLANNIENSDADAKSIITNAQASGKRVGAYLYLMKALALQGKTRLDFEKGLIGIQ